MGNQLDRVSKAAEAIRIINEEMMAEANKANVEDDRDLLERLIPQFEYLMKSLSASLHFAHSTLSLRRERVMEELKRTELRIRETELELRKAESNRR